MRRLDNLYRSFAAVLVLIACVRIALTYSVFNQTFDEPYHIAAGIEWLDRGLYTYDPIHPPPARVAVALLPYLAGMRSHGIQEVSQEGKALLYGHGNYWRDLTLARLGVLPFFAAASWLVWRWGCAMDGPLAALAGTFVFTMLPPVLGHAAIATTDIAATAAIPAAVYALFQWLRKPRFAGTVWLGIAIALAVLSKLSAFVYLPACSIVLCSARWWHRRDRALPAWPPWRSLARWLAAAALIAACLIWAAYRFSVAPFHPGADPSRGWISNLLQVPLPAIEFLRGIRAAQVWTVGGHGGYLLGEYRLHGWWYFFPVVLALKTPLAMFALCAAALLPWRRLGTGGPSTWIPALCAAAILAAAALSTINLGVRHLLPIYPFLAVAAGFGAARLLRASASGIVFAALLLLWLAAASVRAHPDYLASFNELAGDKPERFLVESDLDWGQDLLRLRQVLDQRGLSEVALAYFGTADPALHGIHATLLDPFQPTTGWIAISKTSMYLLV